MTHPTDDSLKPCPFCGSQPEPAPYVLKCVNAYCEAQPSVSGGNDDECATAWNKRALLVEQARTEPHKAEDAPSDAELLDWLEAMTHKGFCPAVVFDDGGHWAVLFDGVQSLPGDGSLTSSFFAGAGTAWSVSVRAAIRAAIAQERKA